VNYPVKISPLFTIQALTPKLFQEMNEILKAICSVGEAAKEIAQAKAD